MPSNLYVLRKAFTELINFARLVGLAVMELKESDSLKKNCHLRLVIMGYMTEITYVIPAPPTAINTLSPGNCCFRSTSCLNKGSSSLATSVLYGKKV